MDTLQYAFCEATATALLVFQGLLLWLCPTCTPFSLSQSLRIYFLPYFTACRCFQPPVNWTLSSSWTASQALLLSPSPIPALPFLLFPIQSPWARTHFFLTHSLVLGLPSIILCTWSKPQMAPASQGQLLPHGLSWSGGSCCCARPTGKLPWCKGASVPDSETLGISKQPDGL